MLGLFLRYTAICTNSQSEDGFIHMGKLDFEDFPTPTVERVIW